MDELYHYGVKFRSGRYPYGSGEDPFQHDGSFSSYVRDLKKGGMTEKEIASSMGISIDNLRAKLSQDTYNKRLGNIQTAMDLYNQGLSYSEIGRRMGINDTSVRSLMKESVRSSAEKLNNTVDALERAVKRGQYVDIGPGSELDLGVSKDRLDKAAQILYDQGYELYPIRVPQQGTNNYTTVEVICKPGTTYDEVMKNRGNISLINEYTPDNGKTYYEKIKPVEIDRNRVQIKYAEEGGIDKDGVIEIRRGVEDLNLGNAHYAQVRIALDNGTYLKGMAVYSDDMPKGKDIIFNTNKHVGTPDEKVFKKQKPDDPNNPFGSALKTDEELHLIQRHYKDSNGNDQVSALNIVREEGDWGIWKKTLASQFLSKQPTELAKRQLNLTVSEKLDELEEIKKLTNPTVKKKYLVDFADQCDSDAVDLKAAALPKQRTHVILPFPEMKENRIYAPNYENGEEVILIRYPHGGTFEIPRLTVDNRNKDAKRTIGNAGDAVGINPKVASVLSGADFDGDTVMVIPTRGTKFTTKSPLKQLENFDPKEAYPSKEGMKKMTQTNKEMGKISNLITDMTIKGASESELARAVKHSMVVIDAEKHSLNYKQSEIDNNIKELKDLYQNGGGASTLISRSKSPTNISKRSSYYKIDEKTGEKIYKETPEFYEKKIKNPETGKWEGTGKIVERTQSVPKMSTVSDARELSSGTPIENIYADHANKLKALGNEARKEYLKTSDMKKNPSASKVYSTEVDSLNDKLVVAKKNKPLERQAQLIADSLVKMQVAEDPTIKMDSDRLKKIKNAALAQGRSITGAHKKNIEISDKEWEAIQAGAVSAATLKEIMQNSDTDRLRDLAMPKTKYTISDAKKTRVKMMNNSGYTLSEIADTLGISTTSISKIINGTD